MEIGKSLRKTTEKTKNLIESKSIKYTVVKIIMLFVLTTVIGFEIFAYNSIKNYYESSLISSMKNQARISQLQYSSYMSRYDLQEVIIGDKNLFYRQNDSQVQILDNSGVVLFDSIASSQIGSNIDSKDVLDAKEGATGISKDTNSDSKEQILSISYPLKSSDQQVGILRLTSSLDRVNKQINKDAFIYILFGIIISMLALLVSFVAAKSFIKPIKKLIGVSEVLAQGDYSIKADDSRGDEISELASTINLLSENIVKREDMKNEFISSVSHELRTPLTSIKGWAITLQSDTIQKDPEMVSQGLKIIESEGDRLSMMVEDLLDFSRLSSSTFKYNKDKIDIVDLVQQVHTQLYPRCQSEGIKFSFTTFYKSLFVYADINRMKEVFINIIDNAIKFTDLGGHIDITIDLNDGDIEVSVKDDGEGIKEDEIAFVASKFYKGSSSKSQTGLGLSICEEIVKAHDGKLIIKSKYGMGTVVSVVIPRLEDEKNI
ncbi:HAMP domain-containing sensor histidine kinase [Anaerococcus lactolyticus]|uniref:histidine kinase n=1 Tax=Anaerococcus lactolyticus S7-1-13 TaxID=1284686 RepID=A0A095WZR8_9FIRM|nr:HAMP domain-containing sensor histidine kinase [Anaerococcus lactolyticus]KGF03113.1 histidine kinase [Anaerococcus lactolyticus S7-1-13]